MKQTRRINVWCSPRNLSTALMYSWNQRADTTVVDEPLYAHYLKRSGREHPGAAAVLAAQSTDGPTVVQDVVLGPYASDVVFFKQMAKHLVGLDRGFLARCDNILLTREPHDMLTSLQNQLPDSTIEDTGFVELVQILDWLLAQGREPLVLEAKQLLLDPPGVLAALCHRLDLSFDPAMLSWPAGPKPEDGVWAPYWYEAAHKSTGWSAWKPKQVSLLPSLEPVLFEARQLYARFLPYVITSEQSSPKP